MITLWTASELPAFDDWPPRPAPPPPDEPHRSAPRQAYLLRYERDAVSLFTPQINTQAKRSEAKGNRQCH
jgi:hypothetical protein